MDLVGKTIGKYQILEELGRGGMGIVYKAYDPTLERQVAIKVLAPHLVWEKDFVERFLREARGAAKLDHPNIVTVYEVGQKGQLYYFVMAYVPGRSLADIVAQRGPLALAEALAIAEQVAAALDSAHERGLVHRDVKPSNVLVDEKGRAVLTDFGIVRAVYGPRLTGSGVTLGTPEYMSPEQARGEDATPASDIYSLGIVLYEILSGDVPFRATTPVAVLLKHVSEVPPPLRARNPAVPEAVEEVLLRALAKDPRRRPATATALVTALREASRSAFPASMPSWDVPGGGAERLPPAPRSDAVRTPPPGPAAAVPAPTPVPTGPITPPPPPGPAAAPPAMPSAMPSLASLGGDLLTVREELPVPPPVGPTPLRGVVEVISALNVGRVREVLRWKTEAIDDLAWSPDGRQLAIASRKQVHVLEVQTLAVRRLEAPAVLRCVAYSPDGQFVAAGAQDHTVRLWQVEEAEPRLILAGPRSPVGGLAISPNGQILVAGTEDGAIPLWRTGDGTLLGALYGHGGGVRSVAFSPFGQILASGGMDRTVRLWRLADGRMLASLVGHGGVVNRVVFSPSGMLLASASEDGSVRLWRVSDEVLLEVLGGHGRGVSAVAFSPDGQVLASGTRDGAVRFWQVATGLTLRALGGFGSPLCRLEFSPDGTLLAIATADGTVRLGGVQPAAG